MVVSPERHSTAPATAPRSWVISLTSVFRPQVVLSVTPSPLRSPVWPAGLLGLTPELWGVFRAPLRKSGKPFFSLCTVAARGTAKLSLFLSTNAGRPEYPSGSYSGKRLTILL